MRTKLTLPLLLLSAVCATPTLANSFSNPYANINLNSAPVPADANVPEAGEPGSDAAIRTVVRAIDDYVLRAAVITFCHQPQTASDLAYFEMGKELGDAAFEDLRAQFDAADPGQQIQNAKRADDMLEYFIVDAELKARQELRAKGCTALEGELNAQR
jgi:hypothetical protein